ncbi:MAG: hypothetical protein PWR01_4743 [Clostridiales bacterium]|nr:hypothetical protein [Clostridiales bacterium]MDN5283670.1 hypothetical protein [Candidatus Ozemobacter sp.]
MKKICLFLLALTMIAGFMPVWAQKGNDAETKAVETVQNEISQALAGKSEFARKIGRYSDFYRELLKLLRKFNQIGMPKPLKFNGKTVKILVPVNLGPDSVGGFFQLSADGETILSYLPWSADLKPLFIVSRTKWENAASADELEELKELMPLKEGYSAGVPVEASDLTDLFLIDYIDQLPSKTQEEREAYTSKNGLKASLGRRTGSSKCLSYAASLASDWWNIAQGNRIGKYESFVNGAREFGMNPRIVESLYFRQPKCPYSFIKETGLDRVTGEKIAYSPKHYAYIMSSISLPKVIKDPLKKSNSYELPENGFGMDLPFCNSFNKSKGKVEKIRQDLKRYGIMYAQHTSRLFSDKISLTLQGVHAVNIVGTAKLKGEPVVIYYETFGKNHRDYLEDSFFGPRLRAFPVKFFYQGIFFPHRIIADLKLEKGKARINFKSHAGKKIMPEKIEVFVNGRPVGVKRASSILVPLGNNEAELEIRFSRKYFHTPEEPDGYVRRYLISNGNLIEISHYEAMLKTLAERKGGLFKKIFGKSDSYTDHLTKAVEARFNQMKDQLFAARNDSRFVQMLARRIGSNRVLNRSELGRMVAEMMKFNKIDKK